MLRRVQLMAIDFYKKSAFTGSLGGMNYRIVKITKETEDSVKTDLLEVSIWPGPLCYAKADDKLMQKSTYPYSEDGLLEITAYLNQQFKENRPLWDTVTHR